MSCAACGERNRDDARFCGACGEPLAREHVCGACRNVNPAGRAFCDHCGASLGGGEAPVAAAPGGGERRQLTVVFCDLVRSTELAARLDPEDWGAALAAYQKAADAVVTRYGGHVAQHLGDGLLAYFGWPHAIDDAAERAVRAGLSLINAAASVTLEGRALAARVGVHTGRVVVSTLGGGMSAETLALGDVPNLSARVQAAAEPGTVVITGATRRLVAGLFVIEELGGRALKGVAEPVVLSRVVRASGVRGRIHAAATSTGLTPFIGRQQERQLLRERWELAQQGQGQVVLITGEPGIGKSRLVQQLKQDLASEAHSWVESAGSPYLQHTPFAPIAEMLVQGFQWSAELPLEERVTTLESVLGAVGLPPASTVPLLAPLLGLTLPERYPPLLIGPEEQRRRLLAMLVDWTIASARLQPMVWVMEDLHWMDASTLELEGLLVGQIATARVLLILTARREFPAPWPLRANHEQLSLARLSRRQTLELIGAVATRVFANSELIETLVARTDGVPLFVEELTRAVTEAGGAAVPHEIPATLQDTLMARLDRLGDARAVAQVGAVLGREFGRSDLIALAERPAEEIDAALSRLCDAELLHPRGFGREVAYSFKHALMQETAYESLLKSRRRELHRRAAEVLSRGMGSPPALLAQHWEAAGEAARAVAAWQQAAEDARRSAASFEAAEHFRRALAVLASLPEGPERDRQELALQYPLSAYLLIAKGTQDSELHAVRARLRELAERVGDATMAVSVLEGFWAGELLRGAFRSALAISEQMLAIAEREGALRPRIAAHADKANSHVFLGELAASRKHGERVLALYDADALRDDPLDRRVLVLSYLGLGAALMGRMDESRRREAELLAAAEARGVVSDLAFARFSPLWTASYRREPEGVLERGERLEAFCVEHKLEMFSAAAQGLLGWATACLGDRERGIALLRQGLRRQQAIGALMALPQLLGLLAEAEAAAGRTSEARATLDDAFGALGEGELFRPDLLRLRGDLLAQQDDDLDAAEVAYRDAIERARAMGALLFELRAATGLARLLQRRERGGEARGLLEPIYLRLPEPANCSDAREARAALEALATGAP